MTVKLYDEDSHIRRFQATVLSCRPAPSGCKIELDRTAFFAEGGGQAADRGVLAGQAVVDVQEEEEHIYHYVKQAIDVGTTVEGEIDWRFRFDNMQQHSGEHIVSGLVYAQKGYHNVGFHMNETVTTIDFDGPLTREELKELELAANRIIYQNERVQIFYPQPEALEQMQYRSKKQLTGRVRLVQLGNSDLCACCAPHVKRTGEVGQIKILASESYKGGVRLTIVCGERAVKDYDAKNELLRQIGAGLSVKPDQIEAAIHRQEAELQRMKERLAMLSGELAAQRLAAAQPGENVCLIETAFDMVAARNLVNGLMEKGCVRCSVLLPKTEEEMQYIICSRAEDVRKIAQELAERFGGRGGGSVQMVQGTVKGEAEEVAAFLQ